MPDAATLKEWLEMEGFQRKSCPPGILCPSARSRKDGGQRGFRCLSWGTVPGATRGPAFAELQMATPELLALFGTGFDQLKSFGLRHLVLGRKCRPF